MVRSAAARPYAACSQRKSVRTDWWWGSIETRRSSRGQKQQLQGLPVAVAQANYADLPEVLAEIKIERVDGMLLDLGLSSDQLAEDADRGFSFAADGPLDLRFDPSSGQPASQLVARLGRATSWRISFIAMAKSGTVAGLPAGLCSTARETTDPYRRGVSPGLYGAVCPGSKRGRGSTPLPAPFRHLRIAVNEELKWLEVALERLPGYASRPGGRLAIISFHSLEDRLVKNGFRADPRLEVLTPKPLVASEQEVAENPRSRSAKFRVATRQAGQ